LIELLVVIAIVAILAGITAVALPALKGAADVTNAAYAISGVLEQARTTAMAASTYVWVGIFEEDPSKPGVAGTGQLVISVVSSADGTNLSTVTPQMSPGSLIQVNKLLKIPSLNLISLNNVQSPTRPALSPANYGVPVENEVTNTSYANPSGVSFPYPLNGPAQYTFTQIIQFNPQGDASRIYSSPVQLMEIGLQPARDGTALTASSNVVAIQLSGIGGNVVVYRP